ncbi:MAG: peptidoglycan-binding protein [Prochloraceae cyanobacterium]
MKISSSYEHWTGGTENDEKDKLCSILKKSEFCICFPNWDDRFRSHKGLTLAKIMEEELILDLIPLYIYEIETCRVKVHSQQDLMLKEKLMTSNHITFKFNNLLNYRWNTLDELKDDALCVMVHYAIVCELQILLKARNYYGGPIDGDYGQRTWFSVRRFQKMNGLTENRIPDFDMLKALKDN